MCCLYTVNISAMDFAEASRVATEPEDFLVFDGMFW